MKILCLISSGRGHLDMGGSGFIKIIEGLFHRGNEIHVMSTKKQLSYVADIIHFGHPTPSINKLMGSVEEFEVFHLEHDFLMALKMLELQVMHLAPDLVLVDRILSLADPLLKYSNLPFVSIGTNGLEWRKENGFTLVQKPSLHSRDGVMHALNRALHWPLGRGSAWSRSDVLNLSFLHQSFYPKGDLPAHHVHLYSSRSWETSNKNTVGISLGNGAFDQSKFVEKVEAILQICPKNKELLVFGNEKDLAYFSTLISISREIQYAGYIDFDDYFPKLSHLIFAGGISTLWSCIEYEVIPIILSGSTHDQDYNAQVIKDSLNLFISEIFERESNLRIKMKKLKSPDEFTCDLNLCLDLIENSAS